MKRTMFLALALLATTACSKSKDDKAASKDKPSAGSTTAAKPTEDTAAKPDPEPAKADPEPAAAAAPFKTTAKDLFAEFGENSGADPMALLDKYRAGATFSGVITTAPGDAMPTSAIMDVDGKNHIMMDFTDGESIKAVKAGDTITATCMIGGEVDTMMQVTDCKLEK